MCDRRGEGREGRDPDVRSGTGRGARGGEDDDGKPDVAQDEADESPREGGGEAPDRDSDEDECVQALEYR